MMGWLARALGVERKTRPSDTDCPALFLSRRSADIDSPALIAAMQRNEIEERQLRATRAELIQRAAALRLRSQCQAAAEAETRLRAVTHQLLAIEGRG